MYHFYIVTTERIHMDSLKKIRVAVLLGGRSNEKEISLESGRNVVYKLSPQKYSALPLFVNTAMHLYHITNQQLVLNSTKEIEKSLVPEQKILWHTLAEIADFVFIALHGGEGENGCVQGALQMLDIPYNGSGVLTSALCMDKYRTNALLAAKGFHVPRSLFIAKEMWHERREETLSNIQKTFTLPCIIKPHDDGCSVFVSKITNYNDLSESIDAFFTTGKTHALVEEFIQGMELTVGVVGNETPHALTPSQAIAAQGILSIEEKFLPGAGENQTPAPLPSATLEFVKKTMENVYAAVDCKGYARIDCFYQAAEQSPTQKERVVILEINTLPGLTPATCIFHQAAEEDIRPMDFIDMIVSLGFEYHQKQMPTIFPREKTAAQKSSTLI
jgi:UDP-N-acetylmuramate--alanine ligase